jgi:hypothetical protein
LSTIIDRNSTINGSFLSGDKNLGQRLGFFGVYVVWVMNNINFDKLSILLMIVVNYQLAGVSNGGA